MTENNLSPTNSILYISHGGGPLPLLGDGAHRQLVDNLGTLAALVARPSAIIVISAHWEEEKPTLTGGATPALIYDYYGFPQQAYDILYPVPGASLLAGKVYDLLHDFGMDPVLDRQRGFDHGLFVPLKIMYPAADIPCIQLSLVRSLEPGLHIRLGQALAGLTAENLLVIGSGFSFHNLKAFFSPSSGASRSMNESFEQWLIATCTSRDLDEKERTSRLVNWENAPAARYCHPREEHLLPLHVCYGVAGRPANRVFAFEVMGKRASAYLW